MVVDKKEKKERSRQIHWVTLSLFINELFERRRKKNILFTGFEGSNTLNLDVFTEKKQFKA